MSRPAPSPGTRGLALLALVVVVGAVFAGAGLGVAGAGGVDDTAESTGVQAGNTTTDGSASLSVEFPDRVLRPGENATLEFVISNDADPGDHPEEIAADDVTARSLSAQLNSLAAPIRVTSERRQIGDLGPGEETRINVTVAVAANATQQEFLVRLNLAYQDQTITYDSTGRRVATETTRETAGTEQTITIAGDQQGATWNLGLVLFLVIPAGIVALWLGGKVSRRTERVLDRTGRVLFGRFVSESSTRERRLEAAYVETTYRTYAAKTYLFALLGLIAGTIAGGFFVAGVLAVFESIVRALAGLPRTITRPLGIRPDYVFEISSTTYWLVVVGGAILIGALIAVLAYLFRWQTPASTAAVRERGIEEGLPRTTAFMYALARGGMEFPEILRTLSRNDYVYGETAREMSVAAREMDIFGRDMITALRRMGDRTPSDQFKTFAENLTSILQSGSDLPTFFEEQYERFREEAEERQEEVLELLATIAEGYVTVLVAGMLFLVTILLVFGLLIADTLQFLMLLIYLVIPLGNAGFAVFLQQKLDELGIARESGAEALSHLVAQTPMNARARRDPRRPDGGLADEREQSNRRVLALYDRVSRVKRFLRNPLETFLWNPTKVLYVVVPIAVVVAVVRFPSALQGEGVATRVLDDILIQSTLFVLVVYAVFREYYTRRVAKIENAMPEMLERLASLNEAGLSIVDGIDRVRRSDLGVLTPELQRIWRDISFGSTVNDAFIRFGRRVRTRAVTRVVTLLTNAMAASGNMGPVLRIAGEQARSEVKLRRQRRQQMLSYLVVIYVSFLVFLVIVVAVNEVLVPSLPDAVPTPEGDAAQRVPGGANSFAQFGGVDKAAYTLVFFHAAVVQAICAGFLAGQLGEGSLRDGAKHAAIMLAVAYVAFLVLSSPVASVTVTGATSDGDVVRGVESVSLSDGGYIAVYDENGLNGELLGHTEYLPAGSHSNVVIPLNEGTINESTEIHIVAHRDTNGNGEFDFSPTNRDGPDSPYSGFGQGKQPTITVEVTYLGPGSEETDGSESPETDSATNSIGARPVQFVAA